MLEYWECASRNLFGYEFGNRVAKVFLRFPYVLVVDRKQTFVNEIGHVCVHFNNY